MLLLLLPVFVDSVWRPPRSKLFGNHTPYVAVLIGELLQRLQLSIVIPSRVGQPYEVPDHLIRLYFTLNQVTLITSYTYIASLSYY
eukprot:COSAG06_NODE_62616_length_264_cov_1.109091_1_plen_85_part_01